MCRKMSFLAVLVALFLGFVPGSSSAAATDDAINNYTIVLVHGFAGWGRDEINTPLGTVHYWGGIVTDIESRLKEDGFKVLTASMGPMSSNWDRACELYAQIANTPYVDYGKAHAARFHHDRFKVNKYHRETDEFHLGKEYKIHLVAHSQGCPTARMLVQLLEAGYPDEMVEKANGDYDDISPLFDAEQDTTGYIHSLTAISGVNNGTTLANNVHNLVSKVQEIVVAIGSMVHGFPNQDLLYDFDLEQFGLIREEDENMADYFIKIKNSAVWDTDDICLYDLKPKGMYETNGWVQTRQNVYYFSYSTQQTFANPLLWPNHHLPTFHMAPYLSPMAFLIGRYSSDQAYGITIDDDWWANDGVVNVKSQKYPLAEMNAHETKAPVEGLVAKPEPGRWYHIATLDSDHEDIVGLGFDLTSPYNRADSLYGFYLAHIKRLVELP